MTDLTEERLAELIAALPPPPQGWVESAIEIPQARAAIDDLVIRASADVEARRSIMADLEQALRREGVEPRRQRLDELRVRLSRLDE